jgi:hypothetical protein
MGTKVTETTANIKTNSDNLEDVMKDVCELKENMATANSESTGKEEIFGEIREREARKPNIIVHGIPEPESEDSYEDKASHDKSELKKIATAVGVKLDTESEIKFCFRVGEASGDKSRPLKVGFYDQITAERLTSLSWKLKDNEKVTYNSSIVCDLTYQQRTEEAGLRKKAEEMNASLSPAEAETHCFRLVGKRGHRILIKTKKPIGKEPENRKRGLPPGTNSQTKRTEKPSRK